MSPATATSGGICDSIESDADFFAKVGPLPKAWDDLRRFPRFYFRSCAEATIHPLAAAESTPPTQCYVLTRDLSRSGLSLMHNAQLFPGQRLDIVLNGQAPRSVEVVWCRRLAPGRYGVGCRFTKRSEEEAETTTAEAS
jgi:hypothetical protein